MGDLFIFVDGIHFDGDLDIQGNKQTYYGEIAPRLSAGKILSKDLSVLFIKDFLVPRADGCSTFVYDHNISIPEPGIVFALVQLHAS